MNTVTVKYFGMDGTGKGIKEAKLDAGRKIEKAMGMNYNPEIIKIQGEIGLLWASPTGYQSKLITDLKPGMLFGNYCGCELTKDEAKERLRLHMLQCSWRPEFGTSHPDATQEETRELRSWFEFQLRYLDGKAKGFNDNDAHDYAGRNPARPELWKEAV